MSWPLTARPRRDCAGAEVPARPSVMSRATAAIVGVALLGAVAAAGLVAPQSAFAQTSLVDVRITPGTTARPTGGLVTGVTVVNTGVDTLTNVQVVVRVPANPSFVQIVTEAVTPLGESKGRAGVIDEKTGFWYHTIASLAGGASVSFNVNWFNPCAGRWPFGVRASDRRSSVSFQFTGPSALNCGADDIASPTPAAWFDLPWPPSVVATSTSTSTSTSSTSTVPGGVATIPQAGGSSTVPGAAPSSSVQGTAVPVSKPPVSQTPVTTRPTTVRPTTTRRPGTTLEIVCKTVGGKRYCGPKSSSLKPGQAKPRAVPPTTKKKSTKK